MTIAAVSMSPGNRSRGTFSLPNARKTVCRAHMELSPLQNLFFMNSVVLGILAILSLKKIQVANNVQSAIAASLLFWAPCRPHDKYMGGRGFGPLTFSV